MESWLEKLGITDVNPGVFDGTWNSTGEVVDQTSPINGKTIAKVRLATAADYERAIQRAQEAFLKWRTVPAPVRGETIRQLGNALRDLKSTRLNSSHSQISYA